nr:hypothetical protein [Tanacetum cinerariifolium]
MSEDKSYEAHEDHKKLYNALEKSLERDYSDQLLSDLEEARQKKRKRRDLPRTPSGEDRVPVELASSSRITRSSDGSLRASGEALNKKIQLIFTRSFVSDKMEAGTTATTLTAKLPILNPREYDLWLMRIEQYFFMIYYSLWEVIKNEKRYGDNKESKEVQRTLLKQQYENFAASSLETLYQTFDRLQKLIIQLEIQGSSSTSQNPQIVAFVSSNSANSTSNTNEADNTAYGVSTPYIQGNTLNSTFVDNLSDAVIYAFLASQPNSP